nr:RecName: Full=Phosphoglycerate kinase, chloroplastic [Physcomitrium patens]
ALTEQASKVALTADL